MDHVTPDYIHGQKKRLEAERRYSHGLLLTVVRCKDKLPEKYLPSEVDGLLPDITESEPEPEREPEPVPRIEPDPSIYEPLSENAMTAERAWEAAKRQLKVDMPKAAYDNSVRDAVLLSTRDGNFVIGVKDGYTRDWMTSRMSNIITRLLRGIGNRNVEVKFNHISSS